MSPAVSIIHRTIVTCVTLVWNCNMKSDEELVTVGLKLCSGPRQMETEMDEQG